MFLPSFPRLFNSFATVFLPFQSRVISAILCVRRPQHSVGLSRIMARNGFHKIVKVLWNTLWKFCVPFYELFNTLHLSMFSDCRSLHCFWSNLRSWRMRLKQFEDMEDAKKSPSWIIFQVNCRLNHQFCSNFFQPSFPSLLVAIMHILVQELILFCFYFSSSGCNHAYIVAEAHFIWFPFHLKYFFSP